VNHRRIEANKANRTISFMPASLMATLFLVSLLADFGPMCEIGTKWF
jgi:hypothetical protein